MTRYIFPLALTGIAISGAVMSATAQNLHTEVVVDRVVDPELRTAVRLSGVAPTPVLSPVKSKSLNQAEYAYASAVDPEIGRLPAASWRDSIAPTPWKGYMSIGYFPEFNLGVNAGYRFVENSRISAGAWAQYTGNTYTADMYNPISPQYDYHKAPLAVHNLTVAADGAYRFDDGSSLRLDLGYAHTDVRNPYFYTNQSLAFFDYFDRRSDHLSADLGWRARYDNTLFAAGAGVWHSAFGDNAPAEYITPGLPPVHQTALKLDFSAGVTDASTSSLPWLGADIDWTFMGSRGMAYMYRDVLSYRQVEMGLGHIRPYLRFENRSGLSGRLGFNLSIATGNDNGHLRIAPDIMVDWRPSPYLSLYAVADGGETFNPMRNLQAIDPYISPYYAYERTNRAIDARGGISIGSFHGFTLGISGGYAIYRGYLSPVLVSLAGEHTVSIFDRVNLNGWHFRAEASYRLSDLLTVKASGTRYGGNNKFDTPNPLHDGARWVADASLTVTPIDPLEIMVGYSLRTDRRVRLRTDGAIGIPFIEDVYPLPDVSSLNAGVTWRFSPSVTAFVFVDNILDHRSTLISGMPAQGVSGLAGVAIKF